MESNLTKRKVEELGFIWREEKDDEGDGPADPPETRSGSSPSYRNNLRPTLIWAHWNITKVKCKRNEMQIDFSVWEQAKRNAQKLYWSKLTE